MAIKGRKKLGGFHHRGRRESPRKSIKRRERHEKRRFFMKQFEAGFHEKRGGFLPKGGIPFPGERLDRFNSA
jgi:hypothetical protein